MTILQKLKKSAVLLGVVFALSNCAQQRPEEMLPHLNGYWQITSAEKEGKALKEYGYSPMIDYIEITKGKGFRKKLRPNLSGGYTTSQDAEQLEVKIVENDLFLHYATPHSQWQEEVLLANETELKLRNDNGIVYGYERFTPISLEE